MAFTAATTTALASGNKAVVWKLELGNAWTGYTEYDWASLTLTRSAHKPAVLKASLINSPPNYSDEATHSVVTQLFGYVKLTCTVKTATGTESEVMYRGRCRTVQPKDISFGIVSEDWTALTLDCECDVTIAPSEIAAMEGDTNRAIDLVDGTDAGSVLGRAYGVELKGGGDEAFDETDQERRRSWVPGGIQLQYDDATHTEDGGPDAIAKGELDNSKYKINYESGAVSILENTRLYDDSGYKDYFVTGLRCYQESLAAGADNCDYMRIFEEALTHPAADGGPGFTLGTEIGHDITAVAAATDKFTIAGDYSDIFATGGQICIQGSTGNDGTYTIAGVTVTGGNTVIETNEDFTDATVDGTLSHDLTIDLSGNFRYEGRISDLFAKVRTEQQVNITYSYDPQRNKHLVRLVTQKASASEDYTLTSEISIDQTRDIRDFFTRVVATGSSELPPNVLAFDGVKIDDDDAAVVDMNDWRNEEAVAGDFFEWNKTNGGSDSTFDEEKEHLADGDQGVGIGCHNLPATENGGANRYDSWYYFKRTDMGAERHIQRIRAVLPPSANKNQDTRYSDDNSETFWPGIWIQVSEDNTNWFDISPDLYKMRRKPGTMIDVRKGNIARAKCRYVRVYLGAFKQGFENSTDPAIGLMALEIYTTEEYRIVKEIHHTEHAITVADDVGEVFTIAGNHAADFPVDSWFEVWGSTLAVHDGLWQVASVADVGATTEITVTGDITDPGVSGNISPVYLYTDHTAADPHYWRRSKPDLWTRLGSRFRTRFLKLGNRYNEFLAHDVALLELTESLRLFQPVSHTCVCDPRVDMWDTVVVNDELNNNVGSILIDGSVTWNVTPTKQSTTIQGVNYLADPLGE